MARLTSCAPMRGPAVAVALLAVLTAGCGRYYWTQPGQSFASFEADSRACLDDIRAIKYPSAPEPGAYRGAESEEEALGLRPLAQPDPLTIEDAKRAECQRRIRSLTLRPRSAYVDALNRCMAE